MCYVCIPDPPNQDLSPSPKSMPGKAAGAIERNKLHVTSSAHYQSYLCKWAESGYQAESTRYITGSQ